MYTKDYHGERISVLGMGNMRLPTIGEGRTAPIDYEKAAELLNTVSIFGRSGSESSLSAMSIPAQDPMDMINDIRSFCYGPSRDKLNQMVNMMAMVQMLQLMKQPDNNKKEDANE